MLYTCSEMPPCNFILSAATHIRPILDNDDDDDDGDDDDMSDQGDNESLLEQFSDGHASDGDNGGDNLGDLSDAQRAAADSISTIKLPPVKTRMSRGYRTAEAVLKYVRLSQKRNRAKPVLERKI
jgi:hypothetical protein